VKKIAAILLTLCLTALPLLAWDVMVFPSLGVNIHDQMQFVLPRRGIYVPQLEKVERGQPFYLYFAAGLKEPLTQPLKLNCEVVMISPAGKRTTMAKGTFFQLQKNSRGVFTSGHLVKVIMENSDPDGVYAVEFNVSDGVENKTATGKVTLTGKQRHDSPVTMPELSKFLSSYYTAPKPERLLAMCKYFIHVAEPELQRKQKNRYDPRPALYGFTLALQHNPQLWQELAQITAEAKTEKQQQFYALIFAGLGAEAVKANKEIIAPQVQANIALFAGRNPLEFKQVTQLWQLDALWMEFLVTGRFSPVQRLINECRRRPMMTVDEVKAKTAKKEPLSAEEKEKFRNFLFAAAIEWSLASNLRQGHRLLWFYLETIRERKLYPDDFAAALIADAVKKAQVKKATPGSKK